MKKLFAISMVTVMLASGLTACKDRTAKELTNDASYTDTAEYAKFQQWKAEQDKQEADAAAGKSANAVSSKAAAGNQPAVTNNYYNTTSTPQEAEKKGWSKAAKGTAIGAGSGAILGAVVNKKNRAAGAVIGGVVGGGVGYGVGRSKDKKDGRVQ